jgi:CheY-like chemotaxis protein
MNAPAAKSGSSAKGTLLLVDADASSQELESKLLADLGYAVVTATDGNHALRVLEMKFPKQAPVLIIADVILPQLSGYELIRRIREKFDAKKVPAILLSKYKSREEELEVSNVGAQSLLSKPLSAEAISQAIDIIERSKKPQSAAVNKP